ncbi:hypothetical protein TELCIR_19496, partial [Teladorsagia circumcincta]
RQGPRSDSLAGAVCMFTDYLSIQVKLLRRINAAVKTVTGKTIISDVDASDTIGDMKAKTQDKKEVGWIVSV